MAKRLTEDDIRRIFREEAERDREDRERMKGYSEETHKVWARLRDKPVRYQEAMVQQVIDTYWEVVEEECNE